MNSGLPSLLDAIFGKQDLATISVDELYEVINEFPSFNAAHFLLSKKLKQENDADYDKESMRTALYFNNSFWLQTLLDEGNKMKFSSLKEEEMAYGPTVAATPGAAAEDDLDDEVEEILDEKTASEAISEESDFRPPDADSQTIESYEEFVAKYNIETVEPVNESHTEIQNEDNHEIFTETPVESHDTLNQQVTDAGISEEAHQSEHDSVFGKNEEDQKIADPVDDPFEIREEVINDYGIFEEIKTKKYNHDLESFDAIFDEAIAPPVMISEDTLQVDESPIVERLEENFNDAARANEDAAQTNEDSTSTNDDAAQTNEDTTTTNDDTAQTNEDTTTTNDDAAQTNEDTTTTNYDIAQTNEDTTTTNDDIAGTKDENIWTSEYMARISEDTITPYDDPGGTNHDFSGENSTTTENQAVEDSPDKTDEHDYDSFDKPVEISEPETERENDLISENYQEHLTREADNTEEPLIHSYESEISDNGRMEHMSESLEEQKKVLEAFNTKNVESIVFTPYHMVDYFASQGVKLVLEENPTDSFGKQLKSFTDWLKVMKRVPEKPTLEKADEKETERIRHFAAHSIQERDILTESMAEVLAKQGMYENAIALYQKLSLIYPPKSAYFASRIEQLKASLP